MGMLTCRVENDDVKDLEEKNLCPRVSSHSFRVSWFRQDREGGTVSALRKQRKVLCALHQVPDLILKCLNRTDPDWLSWCQERDRYPFRIWKSVLEKSDGGQRRK